MYDVVLAMLYGSTRGLSGWLVKEHWRAIEEISDEWGVRYVEAVGDDVN
jgi:hypothetical protein